jgi:prepilin-type N-terminal cleavage/methylation domain-containing protein
MGGNIMKMNKKGFTLIELLIVVAIIAILAAIAIPQFSSYRIKGYNASALSDMRNGVTAESSLTADMQAFGSSDGGAVGVMLTAAVPAFNTLIPWNGPLPPAVGGTIPTPGARLSGQNGAGQVGSVPIGIGNGVNLLATCSQDIVNFSYDSYVVIARHEQGDTAYGADSDNSSSMYRVSNPGWAGQNNIISAQLPAISVGVDGFSPTNTIPGGGSPTINWTIM